MEASEKSYLRTTAGVTVCHLTKSKTQNFENL